MGVAIGAAFAEGIYAFLAFIGFSTLLSDLPWVLSASKGVAAVVLLGLGVHFLRWAPSRTMPEVQGDARRGVALGFAITLFNPTFLATWSAAVAILFSSQILDFRPVLAFPFAISTTFGIVAWFYVLLRLVRRISSRPGAGLGWLMTTVKAMGLFLLATSVWFVWQIFDF